MATEYFPEAPERSFRASVLDNCFGDAATGRVVAEHWDSATGVLYFGVANKAGEVSARLVIDKGTIIRDGQQLRAVEVTSEDELPVYIHCPEEFLAHLSPPRTENAALWRRCVVGWRGRLEVLLGATMHARPGDRIRLLSPTGGELQYEATVTSCNTVEAAPGLKWPQLIEAVDLIGDGFTVAVIKGHS